MSTHHHAHHHGKSSHILIASALLVACIIIEKTVNMPMWQLLIIYLVPYFIVGHETLHEALEDILHGRMFNENFLMSIATIGAMCIGFFPNSHPEFAEAVFVMLFYQVGEWFEHRAEANSKKSIAHLMNIRPDRACVIRNDGKVEVQPEDVHIDEIIFVKPSEKIPLDGIVVKGASSIDTRALTGESMPRYVQAEDVVTSGCINLSGVLYIRVTKPYGESTVAQILHLVENAENNKSKSETFIARFAKIYTPIVVVAALFLALLPPLLSQSFMEAFPIWLQRALTFLVVSCPCALVISVPLSFFGGIGGASRQGILIKGAKYMDILAKTGIVVFDKTGTLTQGEFEVTVVHPEHCSENRLLHLAAHAERYSTHPIAISLKNAYPNEDDHCSVEEVEEISGQGIRARINDDIVCVGNEQLMESVGAQWHPCTKLGTIVHVAINGIYAGHIVISDRIKKQAEEAVGKLKQIGINHTVMLTGDKEEVGKQVATQLNIDEYHCQLLPADKVRHVERLLQNKQDNKTLAFVGDGINDAPVLASADVGIAMGALGSDAAIEAADVVLMDDNPMKVSSAICIARRTLSIARQNTFFAIFIKVLVLLLAIPGISTMWMAVFADVGVTVLAVLNAMRTLRIKEQK